jgi:acetyltransferase-like isoleucine patch superfamily enzyme
MQCLKNLEAHPVWSRAKLGRNVRIGNVVRVHGDPSNVTIGNNVCIDDLVHILALAPLYIGNGVFIGPNCAILAHASVTINDGSCLMAGAKIVTRLPRSGPQLKYDQEPVLVGSFSVLGPNSVLLPGSTLPASSEVSANGVWQ